MTMVSTVANIRRILQDKPARTYLSAAITDTTTKTFTVNDPTLFAAGNIWEHNDGSTGAELRYVESVDTSTSTITAVRGSDDSTAVTHASGSYVLKDPRYRFDLIAQAVNQILDIELFNEGIYDIAEHQVTSVSGTYAYDAPTAQCEEFLAVYQRPHSTDEPQEISDFSRLPKDVDTSLWSTGRMFSIRENLGVAGSLYYVNCKHKLTITTLTSAQERIVDYLAIATLLDWSEPRRLGGPTNQGDQTVTPGASVGESAWYRQQASKMIARERAYLRGLNPPFRRFVRA